MSGWATGIGFRSTGSWIACLAVIGVLGACSGAEDPLAGLTTLERARQTGKIRIGYANEPSVKDRPAGRFPTSSNLGIPEITVPAGFNRIVYEPEYVLNRDKTNYNGVTGSRETQLESPLPVGISFWAGPGDEPIILRAASAYETATRHRKAPADFGPVSSDQVQKRRE